MIKELKMMVGIPGSGKSTWAIREAGRMRSEGLYPMIISRDEIRFSLVEDDEDYFSHEKEVFNEFIRLIQLGLDSPNINTVIADATHISPASRRKVLDKLKPSSDTQLTLEVMNVPVSECIKRNACRKGAGKSS